MASSSLDAASLPPVPLDLTLVLINRFVSSTGAFLNRFAQQCEQRLEVVSRRLQTLELTIDLLESKLPKEASCISEENDPARSTHDELVQTRTQKEEEDVEQDNKSSSDSRLAKYKAMLRVGIPRQAVVIKMQAEDCGDLVDQL